MAREASLAAALETAMLQSSKPANALAPETKLTASSELDIRVLRIKRAYEDTGMYKMYRSLLTVSLNQPVMDELVMDELLRLSTIEDQSAPSGSSVTAASHASDLLGPIVVDNAMYLGSKKEGQATHLVSQVGKIKRVLDVDVDKTVLRDPTW